MPEHICELLKKIADVFHLLGQYALCNRILNLVAWLYQQEIPEHIAYGTPYPPGPQPVPIVKGLSQHG